MNAVVEIIEKDVGAALAKPLPTDAANKKKADTFLTLVSGMVVESQSDYDMATEEVKSLKSVWDVMEEERTSFTVPLNTILSRINDRFQPHLKVLKEAEKIIKEKMAGFITRQEALLLEQRQQAERKAEEERQRLAAEAEKLRAAAADASPEQQAAAEEQAAALEQTAAVVIAQPAVSLVSKGKGVSTPKTLDFEVQDKLALIAFIAKDRPDLAVLLDINDKTMRAMIKLMGVHTKLPGVRVFPKTGITIR